MNENHRSGARRERVLYRATSSGWLGLERTRRAGTLDTAVYDGSATDVEAEPPQTTEEHRLEAWRCVVLVIVSENGAAIRPGCTRLVVREYSLRLKNIL